MGENPSNQEANDALLTLNEIVDKWNIESLMIPSNKYISFNLTGKSEYTIGDGGDIDELRPSSGILNAYYKLREISYPLNIISNNEYNDIVLKDLNTQIPRDLNYLSSYPLGVIKINPISNEGSIVLEVSDQFLIFDSLDAIVDLPSGYIKALRYNLALELSLEYGRQIDSKVEELAVGAKNFIKTTNGAQKQATMRIDSALNGGGSFNILSGDY